MRCWNVHECCLTKVGASSQKILSFLATQAEAALAIWLVRFDRTIFHTIKYKSLYKLPSEGAAILLSMHRSLDVGV